MIKCIPMSWTCFRTSNSAYSEAYIPNDVVGSSPPFPSLDANVSIALYVQQNRKCCISADDGFGPVSHPTVPYPGNFPEDSIHTPGV